MLVVKAGCRPLIGRDLLKKIGYQIVDVNSIDKTDPELQGLLDEYKSLFDGELGCYKHAKILLKVKEGTKVIF